jgi:hypothetical protein
MGVSRRSCLHLVVDLWHSCKKQAAGRGQAPCTLLFDVAGANVQLQKSGSTTTFTAIVISTEISSACSCKRNIVSNNCSAAKPPDLVLERNISPYVVHIKCTHACTRTRTQTYTYMHTHIYTRIHTRRRTHTQTRADTYTHACTNTNARPAGQGR